MNVRELRVGNLLTHYRFGVTKISVLDDLNNRVDARNIEDFEPIGLTDNIFLKCGFEKINGYGFELFGGWVQREDDIYRYSINGRYIELRYIHQLQNLHFILTGKNLNVSKIYN